MTTLTALQQVQILRAERCQCGKSKKRGHAFCQGCYHHLAKDTQRALFQRVPAFGEFYECAVHELRKRERPRHRYIDPRQRVRAAGGAA
jgi:hypothetical protein